MQLRYSENQAGECSSPLFSLAAVRIGLVHGGSIICKTLLVCLSAMPLRSGPPILAFSLSSDNLGVSRRNGIAYQADKKYSTAENHSISKTFVEKSILLKCYIDIYLHV